MGVVHLAQGPDGSRVALKVLRPHIVGDDEARERLAREVELAASASPVPRIAEIIDADPHGEVPYVVTRYVPGLSLYHHVAEEGPITGGDLLHFADCLAEALLAVHSVGVLHRDIKPTNVLMEGRSPGPDRLRPRPGRRGPAAHPDRLAARHAGLPRARDPVRRRRQRRLRRARPGRDGGVRGDRPSAVRQGTGDGDHGPRTPRRARPVRHRRAAAPGAARRAVARPARAALAARAAPLFADARQQAHVGCPSTGADRCRAAGRCRSCPPRRPRPRVRRRCRSRTAAQPLGPPAGLLGEVPVREATPVPAAAAPPARAPPRRRRTRVSRRSSGGPTSRSRRSARPGPARTPAGRSVGSSCSASACWPARPWPTRRTSARPWSPSLVLLLRTASVARQRHGRRQLVRGRARWYDVPTTTVSTPGYLVLALFGSLLLVGGRVAGRAGDLLARLPASTSPWLRRWRCAGLGFAAALWWGPGSGRLREMTRGLVTRYVADRVRRLVRGRHERARDRRTPRPAVQRGPNWAPGNAPWR